MNRRPHPFKTEADLCAVFIAWAQHYGWTAYAETEGWDILLVGADGIQLGIQAKLRLNLDVIGQAIDDHWAAWSDTGPDFRAVLVPHDDGRGICQALGIQVIFYRGDAIPNPKQPLLFHPTLAERNYVEWHYWNPAKRHPLPEYVPDVAAGASAPMQLTKWKIGALKIAATAELRGYVTRADFKYHGIDPRRWTESDWMIPGETPGQFKVVAKFAEQHPVVYPQVRADVAEELRRVEALVLT